MKSCLHNIILSVLIIYNLTILTSKAETEPDSLLPILATTYPVTVIARSNSNRVYLLEDPTQHQPPVGHIILLKLKSDDSAMALRILKTFPEDKMIAAKAIKKYNSLKILENDQDFIAVEKVIDISIPPPSYKDEDDLKEIEGERDRIRSNRPLNPQMKFPLPDPSPVPSLGPSPLNPVASLNPDEATQLKKGAKKIKEETPDEDGEEIGDDSDSSPHKILEVRSFDNYTHWISIGFGLIRNLKPPSTPGTTYFNSGVIRYGITLGKQILFRNRLIQDSIALEAGVFAYKAINFSNQGDGYTILGAIPTLRYNLAFSESFSIFFYGGIESNFVVSSTLATLQTISTLQSILPAIGAGLLFQIGPAWYTRLDGGLESLSLSLVLRF